MEEFNVILLISRWFHIAAAIVAIGGAVFLRFALIPAAGQSLKTDQEERLRESVRSRWARLVHVCIALLLLTGAFNFVILAIPPKVEPMPYHAIFGLKFLAALGVFFIASVLVGRGVGTAAMRKNRSRWLTILIALAGLIVLLSGVLNQVRTHQRQGSTPGSIAAES